MFHLCVFLFEFLMQAHKLIQPKSAQIIYNVQCVVEHGIKIDHVDKSYK